MIWVSVQKRKPIKEGFDFDDSIPVNKVDEDYLYWLDETNAQYEERE